MAKYSILMVDDSPGDIEQMRQAFTRLEEAGDFAGATHAAEALQRLQGGQFDLILVDQIWEGQDGISEAQLTDLDGNLPARQAVEWHRQGLGILRHLRRNNITVPVVLCTRLNDFAAAREASAAGAWAFYNKAELLANPSLALGVVRGLGIEDRTFLHRLLQHHRLEAHGEALSWLAAQRSAWRRQWPAMVEAAVERVAALGPFSAPFVGMQDQAQVR
jgi:CheY-like chemotaxis protein